MGAGREGLGEREKGTGRAARWADERNELIADNGVKGRGELQHTEAAGTLPSAMENQKLSRHGSKASRSSAAAQISAMDLDEQVHVPTSEWGDTLSPSREVIVYTTEDSLAAGAMARRVSSTRGKSPTVARIRSPPSVAEEQEHSNQERLSRARYPKSPRSPRKHKTSNVHAPPEFSQSRLRPNTMRSRGQSPTRRTRVEEDELQDVLAEIIHDQSLTLARAARRQGKATRSQGTNRDVQEGPVNDAISGRFSPSGRNLGSSLKPGSASECQEESPGKPGRKTKPRRPKRKADVVHDSSPDDTVMEERAPGFHPLQNLQDFMSRAATRKESSSTSSTWMELFADIIMWRDVPKSTLLCGAGCFCILSASFIQDVRCGVLYSRLPSRVGILFYRVAHLLVERRNLQFRRGITLDCIAIFGALCSLCTGSLTFTAYIALVYLAGVFLHRNFLRGGAAVQESGSWELGEAEALEMLKVILPAVNLLLNKCGVIFCGDPSTTLKVAAILWFLAQAGYFLSLWSLLRFGFVLMFIVPKLYSCYSHQLHVQAEACADRFWKAWSAYAHKKAAIFGTLVIAWNLSSATSRLYGAFLLLVIIKRYTHHLAASQVDQMDTDHPLPVSEQPGELQITPAHVDYSPSQEQPPCTKIEAG